MFPSGITEQNSSAGRSTVANISLLVFWFKVSGGFGSAGCSPWSQSPLLPAWDSPHLPARLGPRWCLGMTWEAKRGNKEPGEREVSGGAGEGRLQALRPSLQTRPHPAWHTGTRGAQRGPKGFGTSTAHTCIRFARQQHFHIFKYLIFAAWLPWEPARRKLDLGSIGRVLPTGVR